MKVADESLGRAAKALIDVVQFANQHSKISCTAQNGLMQLVPRGVLVPVTGYGQDQMKNIAFQLIQAVNLGILEADHLIATLTELDTELQNELYGPQSLQKVLAAAG